MALSNSQYNAVMRDYEKRQLKNRHEREARIARVYQQVPQLKQLEQEISAQAAACARQSLSGSPEKIKEMKAQLEEMRLRRKELLKNSGFPEDYMEMRYTCPDCRDTGFTDGKRCHCFERARLRILYAQSGIEQALERENFSTFSFEWYDSRERLPQLGMTELDYMKLVAGRCREFAAEFPDKGENLLFTGSTGVGKTFLTNCIAKALIDRGISVIYLSSQDLFELFSKCRFGRDGQDEAEETCRHILDCQMLIIDDLGTELNNSFVSSQLFYCINERINRKLGTIISTNLSMDMLRDTYSDRVASRLMSHYATIPLYGGDIRVKKRQRYRD